MDIRWVYVSENNDYALAFDRHGEAVGHRHYDTHLPAGVDSYHDTPCVLDVPRGSAIVKFYTDGYTVLYVVNATVTVMDALPTKARREIRTELVRDELSAEQAAG